MRNMQRQYSANKEQDLDKKSNTKKKMNFFSLVSYIFIIFLIGIFLVFPPNYVFLYHMFVSQGPSATDKRYIVNKRMASFFYNDMRYYQAVQLVEQDILQAQTILVDLLKENIGNRLRKKALGFLGELYLAEREYDKAMICFWDLLVLEPSKINRINYELANRYVDIFSQKKNEEEAVQQSVQSKEHKINSILLLETIKQSNIFILNVSDEEHDTELPQW